jgi:hypothetical protein
VRGTRDENGTPVVKKSAGVAKSNSHSSLFSIFGRSGGKVGPIFEPKVTERVVLTFDLLVEIWEWGMND